MNITPPNWWQVRNFAKKKQKLYLLQFNLYSMYFQYSLIYHAVPYKHNQIKIQEGNIFCMKN